MKGHISLNTPKNIESEYFPRKNTRTQLNGFDCVSAYKYMAEN